MVGSAKNAIKSLKCGGGNLVTAVISIKIRLVYEEHVIESRCL